ncbi:hypothetical protein DEU56DRAFT_815117 [Suillus clintonianus]|uniref:uncharacterized protein n=1 Tax=Suillus clintonianus TaxID=1904413 RepID=UPI001B865FF8|nr:uncharacterized protein DEU56DRAFT_815117 [Suillus clintonianus]KAG2130683.1 hypothetical protein DEU56DRAFT_815117 [Suillus clintonianus]
MASAKSVFIFFSGLFCKRSVISHRAVPSLSRQPNGAGRPAQPESTTSRQCQTCRHRISPTAEAFIIDLDRSLIMVRNLVSTNS